MPLLNGLQKEGTGAASRRGRWAGISLVYHLTGQKAITEASAEAVDGGPSEKAGISLLALTTQGGASPQLPAPGGWRLQPSRAQREQHLLHTQPAQLCSWGQRSPPQPALGNAETAKEPLA